MEPLSILSCLAVVVKYLYQVSEKAQQNREECRQLANYANAVFSLIQGEIERGVSPELLERLHSLKRTLVDLNSTVDNLSNQSMLKKILWQGLIANRIASAYKGLGEAIELFKLGTRLDQHRFQAEREMARIADTEQLYVQLMALQHSDHEILDHLEIQNAQLQEAMLALHRRFLIIEDSLERRFLEKANIAMQRRSGRMIPIPDKFVITSLDVVIHRDKKLGEGGFGQVFQAQWQNSLVAVKVFDRNVHPIIFQKEIDVWKRLKHRHILQFFGVCFTADPPFLVCDLKSQGDAVHFLQRNPSANRCKIIYESSLGLEYLHQNDVVHGDLKASNVLIDEDGSACLCDFGLSEIRSHTTTAPGPSNPTNHGSLRWMAPEQMSRRILNKTTDIYSFGMTIYEMFTGAPPFTNTPDSLLFYTVVDQRSRPPRPTERSIMLMGLDDTFWKLIEDCWDQKPRDRPVATTLVQRLRTMRPSISDVNLVAPGGFPTETGCALPVLSSRVGGRLAQHSSASLRGSVLKPLSLSAVDRHASGEGKVDSKGSMDKGLSVADKHPTRNRPQKWHFSRKSLIAMNRRSITRITSILKTSEPRQDGSNRDPDKMLKRLVEW